METDKPNVMAIKISNWWFKNVMRWSLFTILVRVGVRYELKKDVLEHLMADPVYIAHTKQATKRFFEGYTVYGSSARMWVQQFSDTYGIDRGGKNLTKEPA